MAKSEFYGAYAGQPLSFACSACRKSPRFFENRSTVGRRYTTTGRARKQRSRGSNFHRWPDVAYEYQCLDCGHTGWSRHPDVQRVFNLKAKESTP